MVVAPARHQKKPAKKPSRSSKAAEPSVWQRHARDLWIVAILVVGAFVALGEVGALGPVGRVISRGLSLVLGVGRFALPVMLLALGGALVVGRIEVDKPRLLWGITLGLVSLCGLGHLAGGHPKLHDTTKALAHAGGWLGVLVGGGLDRALGIAGALVVLLALLVVAIMVSTGIGLRALVAGTTALVRAVATRLAKWWTMRPRNDVGYEVDADESDVPVRRRRMRGLDEFDDVGGTAQVEAEDSSSEEDEGYEGYEGYEDDEAAPEEYDDEEPPVLAPLARHRCLLYTSDAADE